MKTEGLSSLKYTLPQMKPGPKVLPIFTFLHPSLIPRHGLLQNGHRADFFEEN